MPTYRVVRQRVTSHVLYIAAESRDQVREWLKHERVSMFHSKSTEVTYAIEPTAFAPDIKDHVLEAP